MLHCAVPCLLHLAWSGCGSRRRWVRGWRGRLAQDSPSDASHTLICGMFLPATPRASPVPCVCRIGQALLRGQWQEAVKLIFTCREDSRPEVRPLLLLVLPLLVLCL